MKLAALSILLFFVSQTKAQPGFLTLKRGDRTVKTWTTGSPINLKLNTNIELGGLLLSLKPDSIVVRTFAIQRFETSKGFIFFDTAYTGNIIVGLDEIKTVEGGKKGGFAYKASEYTAYTAAALFATMALVNGAKFDDKFSTSLTQAAIRGGGLLALGRLFHILGRTEYKMGKKYRMAVVMI